MKKRIEKQVFINAPVDRVFEYLTNPPNLPAIWPSMIEVKNVKRDPSGAHSFDWTYKMAGIHFRGHAETTDVEKNRRLLSKTESGIPSAFEYRYEAKGGGTELSVRVEYEIPNKILAKLAEPIVSRLNEREAETMLQNLKLVMEHGKAEAAE